MSFELSINGLKCSTYYAHPCTLYGNDVLDSDIALRLVEAVSARLIESTKVLGIEARDVDFAS